MGEDAKLKIGGDAKEAIREIARVTNRMNKLEEASKKTGKTSRTAGRRGSQAFSGMASQLKGVVFGIMGAGGLIRAFQMATAEMKKTAEAGKESIASLQGAIAGAGDIAAYPQIAARLRGMGGEGAAIFGMKQRGDIYEAIRGAMPLAPRERVMELVPEAMRAGRIFGGIEPTVRFAGVMGELAKRAPELSRGDIGDIATFMTQAAGKFGAQLETRAFKGVAELQAVGVGTEEALGMVIASMEAGLGARGPTSYASYLQQIAEGRKPTMTPATAALLKQRKRRDYTELIRKARREDIFERQIAAAGASEDIRAAQFLMEAEAELSLTEYDERREEIEGLAARKFTENYLRGRGVSAARRAFNLFGYDVVRALGASPEGATWWMPSGAEEAYRTRKGAFDLGEKTIRKLSPTPTLGGETLDPADKVGNQ